MSDNYNENGYTAQDIQSTMQYVENTDMPSMYEEIILDALEFYKEMNYTNG